MVMVEARSKMVRPVEVPTSVPRAPALLVIHADGHGSVDVDGQGGVRWRMGEAAFADRALADSALVFAADLTTAAAAKEVRRKKKGEFQA